MADGACTRVTVAGGDGTCPSFEEITITRVRPPETRTETIELSDLSEPDVREFNTTWYAYIAGVGGMGNGPDPLRFSSLMMVSGSTG